MLAEVAFVHDPACMNEECEYNEVFATLNRWADIQPVDSGTAPATLALVKKQMGGLGINWANEMQV